MPTDTKLKELIINELTEEQYKALTPNDDELYLTPDGSITKNENGSYVLDGDVDITGTTKLNGGIKPIHTYKYGYETLKVYFEIPCSDKPNTYTFLGSTATQDNMCIGWYRIINGKIQKLGAIFCFGGANYPEPVLRTYSTTQSVNSNHLITDREIENLQSKLFRHNLVLNGKYWKEYITDSNLKVDSIQDLDTITHAKNGTTLVLGAENQLLLIKQGDTWKIGAETVTTVSDDVTTL